jgi:hypothetical protein
MTLKSSHDCRFYLYVRSWLLQQTAIILSKFFIHQLMHTLIVLKKNIKIDNKIDINFNVNLNVNFNVKFNIVFKTIHLCISWWIKKLW